MPTPDTAHHIHKLTRLATTLDVEGRHTEADRFDRIVRHAQWWNGSGLAGLGQKPPLFLNLSMTRSGLEDCFPRLAQSRYDITNVQTPRYNCITWAAVAHVTGDDLGLSCMTSRTAHPGEGQQGLHWDSHLCAANALWVLDDFT